MKYNINGLIKSVIRDLRLYNLGKKLNESVNVYTKIRTKAILKFHIFKDKSNLFEFIYTIL